MTLWTARIARSLRRPQRAASEKLRENVSAAIAMAERFRHASGLPL
jgi:hypothetical protein